VWLLVAGVWWLSLLLVLDVREQDFSINAPSLRRIADGYRDSHDLTPVVKG
jgi:hypothetical protein